MSSVETTIRNEVCEIAQVVLQLERLAAAQNLPPASVWPLNVALDEVLSNIINYGRNRLTLKRRLAHRREGGRMELSETVTNGVTVLEVAGRIDSLTAPDFEARLSAAMNAARLVLDFRELLYISSAGFRVLYRAAQRVKDSNGKLVICGLSDSVRELFDITGFTQIFTFVGSRDDGIAALG